MSVTIHGYLDIRILSAETKTPQQLCCIIQQKENYYSTSVKETKETKETKERGITRGITCSWEEIATFIVTCLDEPFDLQVFFFFFQCQF